MKGVILQEMKCLRVVGECVCDGTAVLARHGSLGDALEHALMVLMGRCGERGG